jgi:hypothetical protein
MHVILIGAGLLFTTEILAHPGNGSAGIHLHGWDYGIFSVILIALALLYRAKK